MSLEPGVPNDVIVLRGSAGSTPGNVWDYKWDVRLDGLVKTAKVRIVTIFLKRGIKFTVSVKSFHFQEKQSLIIMTYNQPLWNLSVLYESHKGKRFKKKHKNNWPF